MPHLTHVVTIFLGWVVLDRPDQSGVYVAKDLAAGWAYLIADHEGDTRFRGQGPSAGGVDVALRCALLASLACVPERSHIRILVDSRLSHRAVVRLALGDRRVMAAIGSQQVSVLTRPLERSAVLVQAAAERAASTALRAREREDWEELPALPDTATEISRATAEDEQRWRVRRAAARRVQAVPAKVEAASLPVVSAAAAPAPLPMAKPARAPVLKRLLSPLLDGARVSLASAGLIARPAQAPRKPLLEDWLRDFDGQVQTIRTDLEDIGA
ncbi:MAG: hypothetical protein ACRYGM_06140 [Janthinobacterium lividum]